MAKAFAEWTGPAVLMKLLLNFWTQQLFLHLLEL
jgi:hypothetical protein